MSKKTRKRTQRDSYNISKRRLLREHNRRLYWLSIMKTLSEVEDTRRYQPKRSFRHDVTLDARRAIRRIAPLTKLGRPYRFLTNRIRYVEPFKTAVCVRRRVRRFTLFARGHAGRGKRIRTPKRVTEKSKVRC